MAYPLLFVADFGPSQTGLTLNAQLYDHDGTPNGAAITTGFVEVDSTNAPGIYSYRHTAIPDSHRGTFVMYKQADQVKRVAFSINPEEAENVDTNVSGLAPAGEYDAELTAIQADLDNPDQYKADVSGLAPAGEYDAELAAIQADLDNPDQYKADVSGLAPAGEYDAELAAIQADLDDPAQYKANVSALALQASVDDLEGRLTAARAGYLDNLSGGAVALQSSVDDLEGRLTAARAGYLDNLSAGAVALEATLAAMKGPGWTAETLKAIYDAIAGLNDPALAAIADAVWDEATIGHVTAGTFGAQLKTQMDALVNRLGDFLGTGVNTVKGYLEGIASKAATLPSQIGNTFTPVEDSTEAIRDKINALGATVRVQPSSVIRDGEWEFYTHDVVVQPVTGLGVISGYKDVWVTLKKKRKDPDAKAILLFSSSVGLEVLNGSSAVTAGDASVAVDSPSDGDITMKLKTGVSERLGPWEDLVWGIKWKDAGNEVFTLLDSLSTIKAGPVKATS